MAKSTRRIRKRTRGRELALQYLYQYDLLGAEFAEEAEAFIHDQETEPDAVEFALALIRGVIEHCEPIDSAINTIAKNWTLARMVVVDRTILRIAAYELGFCEPIPTRVSINEAIELAKRYSTDKSSAFVNGILDRIPALLTPDRIGEPSITADASAERATPEHASTTTGTTDAGHAVPTRPAEIAPHSRPAREKEPLI